MDYTLSLIPAQVRAQSLAQLAAQIGVDLAHLSHGTPGGIYADSVREDIAQARELLNIIEAALQPAGEPAVRASDCSLHNGPALPVGQCDCKVEPLSSEEIARATDLLDDPDAEDCERFTSWFGHRLLGLARCVTPAEGAQ